MRLLISSNCNVSALLPSATRDLRVNGRWLQGCRDKMTDYYPVMLVEGGVTTYWNYIRFADESFTHIVNDSVRMRSHGDVICW